MDPPDKPPGPPVAPPPPPPPKPPSGNPAFRAMGLPTFRAKLPSRNWLIFLSLSTTFGLAIAYDRREAKRARQRWCTAVQHLSREPLGTLELPRKVTVYLSAPPGDGISPSREHFREYIKPVFTAAALEFDVVEGRRNGELRWRIAERVRKERGGGRGAEGEEFDVVEEVRRKNGTRRVGGVQGDVVVGRHAWKEYVRGVHEGWLGPLEPPPPPPPTATAQPPDNNGHVAALNQEGEGKDVKSPPDPEPAAATKPAVPPPYISPASYPSTTTLPSTIPKTFDPVAVIPHPHILGFLNTPVRLYRFLTRRRMADAVGREAAAIALGAYASFDVESGEIERCAQGEEQDWPKKTWKEGEGVEIAEGVVVDSRIGERMRRFVSTEDAGEMREA